MLLYLFLERSRRLLVIRFLKPRLFLGSLAGNFLYSRPRNCDSSFNVAIVGLVPSNSTNLALLVSQAA